MISLQELTVEGIRSYKDESTIRFGPNLTLIFGANGAGKTVRFPCLSLYYAVPILTTLRAFLLLWRPPILISIEMRLQ